MRDKRVELRVPPIIRVRHAVIWDKSREDEEFIPALYDIPSCSVDTRLAEVFMTKLSEIQAMLTPDIRCRIRGHDFVRVLTWYLRAVEKYKHLNDDSVRQMLYIALLSEELASLPMFAAILSRLL
jgi:hypothetical protein